MHLIEMLKLRSDPASAVFLGLTRRCPLTCRHCSTNSLLSSEEHSADIFLRFVDTFTVENHPEMVLMSGGEALLRPRLVKDIARRAAAVGVRSNVLSGMFFARSKRIPRPIMEAIDEVDHFSASLDVFHEEQVPRAAVIDVLRRLVDAGKDVSVQIVGMDDEDPYLAEVTAEIRDALDGRVPMLVGLVGRSGRATEWLPDRRSLTHLPLAAVAEPCGVAAWPIVAFDGTVIACCNQGIVDQGAAAPAHLRLGHAATDDWPTIRDRCRMSPLLRTIRTFGPWMVAQDSGAPRSADFCTTCVGLSRTNADNWAARRVASPTFPILEREVRRIQEDEGPTSFIRRHGSSRYATLCLLGYQPRERQCAG